MTTEKENWTAIACGAVERKPGKPGEPKGKLKVLVQMDRDWSKIPNTLLEDESGQLWLGWCEPHGHNCPQPMEGTILELVDVESALTWIKNVSEFADGYDGDIADVCRIALAELARRPCDIDRVKRAIAEEAAAGTKFRCAQKVKRP